MVKWYCNVCDPASAAAIEKRKLCSVCHSMTVWKCDTSSSHGLYSNFARHADGCESCVKGLETRERRKAARANIYSKERVVEQGKRGQEPAKSILASTKTLHAAAGISQQTFDLVLRSTNDKLEALHGGKTKRQGHDLLNAENLLLLFFVFLRKKPLERDLANQFHVAQGSCFDLVRRVATIVAPELENYVKPPCHPSKIKTGYLQDAAAYTDTSNTRLKRPQDKADRHLYYCYKRGGSWTLKWQVTIGLDGSVWEHGSASYPGSVSDKQIFKESDLPELLAEKGMHSVGDSHYVHCVGMYGKKVGKVQSVTYAAYNEEIDSVRNVVENLNAKIKNWASMRGWDCDRHNLDFFTQCLGSVCGLINLELREHPVRKERSTLLPRVAVPRLRKRKIEEGKREKSAKKAKTDKTTSKKDGSDGSSSAGDEGEEAEDEGDEVDEGDEDDESDEGDEVDEGDEDDESDEGDEQEGQTFYAIEGIKGKQIDKKHGLMYLVKHKGSRAIWLTPEHITEDAIREYEDSIKAEAGT
jgi:hypothetical protein